MRKIFLLRGAPGSGKSSFIIRHHLQPYAISRDQIRLLLADLTVYYEKETDCLRHVIPRYANVETERVVDQLVKRKMAAAETVIVDGTHIVPKAIEHFKPWVKQYRYELFVVDLMQGKTLAGLLKRNHVRVQYDWVKPEVIKSMYKAYMTHSRLPAWVHVIGPQQMRQALSQRESELDRYAHVVAIPDRVATENFPHVHLANFYFSFNDLFSRRYGRYRNVVTIGKTKEEVRKDFYLPFFAFKFHHKHFLISAYPIRNEMLDPIHKARGVWRYNTGLMNAVDFVQQFPENRRPHVHQFNLSKLDPTRLLYIW